MVYDKNLMSIIVRLERMTYALPCSKFFMNRIRGLQRITSKKRFSKIPNNVKEYLTPSPPFPKTSRRRYEYKQSRISSTITLLLGRLLLIWVRRVHSRREGLMTLCYTVVNIIGHKQRTGIYGTNNYNLS